MKYEYKIIPMNNRLTHDDILYKMGCDGWEFICFNTYISEKFGYFKKEIKEEPIMARICLEDGSTLEK